MIVDRGALLGALLNAGGRNNAITGQELEKKLLGRTTRRQTGMRAAIRKLVADGYAIGSHPARGYYMIEDDEDLAMATGSMVRRIASMAKRLEQLVENAR